MPLAKNKTMITIILILFVAFLIESPLYSSLVALFSFAPVIAHLIAGVAGYISILACVLLVTKQYFNKSNFFKALGTVVVFAVVDKVISAVLFNEIIALFYQIIRPVIAVGFVLLAIKLISNSKLKKDLKLLAAGIVVFVLNIASNVLEYVRLTQQFTAFENVQNDFFSYINLLTPSNSAYSVIASLCGYVLIFIALAFAQKGISQNI